jgi:hypothetical protein
MTSQPLDHPSERRKPIPRLLALTGNRVLRTKDLAPFYSNPTQEAARLAAQGILLKLATGYYVVVPEDRRDGGWRPAVEDVALAIGVADYGPQHSALAGPSAARALGVLPRALSKAVLAVPVHRSPLKTVAGQIVFTFRNVERLDLQRASTELATGYTTTPEQTILDLAARPLLGGISPDQAAEARRALLPRCDLDRVASLAHVQHRKAALDLIRSEAAGSI